MGHQHEDFSRHVGETFIVAGGAGREWRLAHVSELAQSGDYASFALEFEGAPAEGSQGLVALDHPELGTCELFVVAVGPGRFEAVFNQLVGVQA